MEALCPPQSGAQKRKGMSPSSPVTRLGRQDPMSIHRGTSHFHRRFRNLFWANVICGMRGTGLLLLHLFARFVCLICLPILVYIHIHISQSSLAAFFGEVYEYRGNFMGQFLRSAGLQNTATEMATG